jgi:hypothetical protein
MKLWNLKMFLIISSNQMNSLNLLVLGSNNNSLNNNNKINNNNSSNNNSSFNNNKVINNN